MLWLATQLVPRERARYRFLSFSPPPPAEQSGGTEVGESSSKPLGGGNPCPDPIHRRKHNLGAHTIRVRRGVSRPRGGGNRTKSRSILLSPWHTHTSYLIYVCVVVYKWFSRRPLCSVVPHHPRIVGEDERISAMFYSSIDWHRHFCLSLSLPLSVTWRAFGSGSGTRGPGKGGRRRRGGNDSGQARRRGNFTPLSPLPLCKQEPKKSRDRITHFKNTTT